MLTLGVSQAFEFTVQVLDLDKNVVPFLVPPVSGPYDQVASLSDDTQPNLRFAIEGISFPDGKSVRIRATASASSRIASLSEEDPLDVKLQLKIKAPELFKWCALRLMAFGQNQLT